MWAGARGFFRGGNFVFRRTADSGEWMTGFQQSLQKFSLEGISACPECDLLLQRNDEEVPGIVGKCPRCGAVIHDTKKDPVQYILALSLSGLILFTPAMLLPIMKLNVLDLGASANILQGVSALYRSGFYLVAFVVLLTSAIIPFVKMALLFCLSVCIRFKLFPDSLRLGFRAYLFMEEWGMLEIYMLGILVSIIKLGDIAQISYGIGLYCFVGVLALSLFSSAALSEDQYWNLIEKVKRKDG